jgi:N-acetylglucosamine kinase-like BadF-type ATPase
LLPSLHGAHLVIDEDVVAAHRGAFAFPSCEERVGVLCIAGTGANSFGIGADGKRARADGSGPLLGDRGSGYRIGEAALRATCAAYDGSVPTTTLLVRVLDHFGVTSVDALIPIVYAPDFTKDKIAELVHIVLQCALENDEVARKILSHAGQELAATCGAVMGKLGTQRVAPYGGLLQNETPVRAAFLQQLQAHFPQLELCEPRYDATVGAALLTFDVLVSDGSEI